MKPFWQFLADVPGVRQIWMEPGCLVCTLWVATDSGEITDELLNAEWEMLDAWPERDWVVYPCPMVQKHGRRVLVYERKTENG